MPRRRGARSGASNTSEMRFRSSARRYSTCRAIAETRSTPSPPSGRSSTSAVPVGAHHCREGIVRGTGVLVDERDAAGRDVAVEPHRRVAVAAVPVHHRVGEELLHQEGDSQAHRAVEPGGLAHLGEEGLDLRQRVAAGGEDPAVSGPLIGLL